MLEIPVYNLSEIKKMVLGFGKNAKVIAPFELKEIVKKEALQIIELY